MNHRLFAVAAASAFVVLSLNACSEEKEPGEAFGGFCDFPNSFCDENSRAGEKTFLLNGKDLFEAGAARCQFRPSPYPLNFQSDTIINPDGNAQVVLSLLPSCGYIEVDSIKEACDAWREEALEMRSDSSRTAELTSSNGRTIIQLNKAFLDAELGWFQLEDSKNNDTLHIAIINSSQVDIESKCLEEEKICFEKRESSEICSERKSKCLDDTPSINTCPISLEIALNRIEENIKVVAFEDQVFQVKIQ